MKAAVAALAALLALPVVFIGAAMGALGGAGSAPTPAALAAIPADYLALYQSAAADVCPGLPWTVLAGIGTVESNNGQSTAPGVHSGTNTAGAAGPMQFEPATFAAYDQPVPPGGADPPTPYDPVDAVYAAARDLCANGGADPSRLPAAVFAYNHDPAYVSQVLALADAYSAQGATPDDTGAAAVSFAVAQLGVPYRWGGDGSGGFDCSGLTQAAYRAAGINLPRTAQAQFDAGPALAAGEALEPGDLIFFGADPAAVDHVGIVTAASGGTAEMVDAPHTGAAVRVEPVPASPGAAWGAERYVGATRPAALSAAPA